MLKCRRVSFFPVFVSVAVLLFASLSYAASSKSLYEKTCSACHSLDIVAMKKNRSVKDWTATIDKMKSAGLNISDADRATIAEYLAKSIK